MTINALKSYLSGKQLHVKELGQVPEMFVFGSVMTRMISVGDFTTIL
jgi:hypothetical protein